MKKLALVFLSVLLLGSSGVVFAQNAAKTNITLAYIQRRGDEVHFQIQAKGFEARAKEVGVKSVIMDAKLNPEAMLAAVDTAIALGAKGIALCLVDQKLGEAVYKKAKDAGVEVIAIDMPFLDSKGTQIAPYLGLDNGPIGTQAGGWLGDYMIAQKWDKTTMSDIGLAVISYNEISACKDRTDSATQAILKKVPNFPKANIFNSNYKNADILGGMEAMQALMSKNPKIKKWVVYSCNDEGVVGASRALEQAGLAADSVGCGIGAGLAKGEFEKTTVTAFKASAYVGSDAVGAMAVDLIYNKLVNGKAIPMNTPASSVIVTKDNYKKFL